MARERRGRENEKLSGRDALIQDGEEAGDATEGIFLARMRRRGGREGAWEAWRGGAAGVARRRGRRSGGSGTEGRWRKGRAPGVGGSTEPRARGGDAVCSVSASGMCLLAA